MAIVTIVLDAVHHVQEISAVVAKARRDLRNMVAAQRRVSDEWNSVEFALWLETDAFEAQDFRYLGPDRRILISDLASIFESDVGAIWVPSLHGVVRLGPALDVGGIREALQHQWPGHHQIHIEGFSESCAVTTNLARIVNYAYKHRCTTDYYDKETGEITPREWENSWLAAYYTWLHEWSRGFHRTRILVGPKRIKMPVVEQIEDADGGRIKAEPMSFLYEISRFDTDNYYWRCQ